MLATAAVATDQLTVDRIYLMPIAWFTKHQVTGQSVCADVRSMRGLCLIVNASAGMAPPDFDLQPQETKVVGG